MKNNKENLINKIFTCLAITVNFVEIFFCYETTILVVK